MQTGAEVRLAYGQLLRLGRDLAAAGNFEAAYHALMSAVHCAEDAADSARLAEMAGVLQDIKEVIDAIRPPHKLSTQAARMGRCIFDIGAAMADGEIKRLKCQKQIAELRRADAAVGTGTSSKRDEVGGR
jgi:hypothetical protein